MRPQRQAGGALAHYGTPPPPPRAQANLPPAKPSAPPSQCATLEVYRLAKAGVEAEGGWGQGPGQKLGWQATATRDTAAQPTDQAPHSPHSLLRYPDLRGCSVWRPPRTPQPLIGPAFTFRPLAPSLSLPGYPSLSFLPLPQEGRKVGGGGDPRAEACCLPQHGIVRHATGCSTMEWVPPPPPSPDWHQMVGKLSRMSDGSDGGLQRSTSLYHKGGGGGLPAEFGGRSPCPLGSACVSNCESGTWQALTKSTHSEAVP